MEIRLSIKKMILSFFVILFTADFSRIHYKGVLGVAIDDDGTMFMEEIGENEIIPIESEREPRSEYGSDSLQVLQRHVRETPETQKLSSPKIDIGPTWGSEYDDGSGDGDEEDDDEYYDLDQNLEGTMKEDNSEDSIFQSTPILPTRVVPALKSPVFGDSEGEVERTKTVIGPTDTIQIQPTNSLAPNGILSSNAHYDVSLSL